MREGVPATQSYVSVFISEVSLRANRHGLGPSGHSHVPNGGKTAAFSRSTAKRTASFTLPGKPQPHGDRPRSPLRPAK